MMSWSHTHTHIYIIYKELLISKVNSSTICSVLTTLITSRSYKVLLFGVMVSALLLFAYSQFE